MAEPRKYEIRGLKGTPNYPIGTDRKILLALEDTGYAFNFYKDYAHRNYSIPEADIVGIGGADNFPNVLRKEIGYDAYLIVYDAGADKDKLDSIADALEELQENTSAPIYLFTPKCFEEVLLSFTYLADYVKANHNTIAYEVFRKLQGILNGDSDINYFTIKNEIMSEEKKIEHYLEELTKDTAWVYKHGERNKQGSAVMSQCWIQDCCLFDKTKEKNKKVKEAWKNCTPLNINGYKNKLDFISNYSLLGGLSNILNEELGYTDRGKKLTRLSKKKYDALVGRLQ